MVLLPPQGKNQNNPNLPNKLNQLNSECRNCKPITPFECISGCRVYELKSELRQLWEAMNNPNYMKELFNVIKNKPRLHVMQALSDGTFSLSQLQEGLKKAGHNYRPDHLTEECLRPLMAVGLVAMTRQNYRATRLGSKLILMLGGFEEFADKMPTHSECNEEALLMALIDGPKTFEDIEALVAPKNVSRTLKRLHSAGLISTSKERDYIFFFKTIRSPEKEDVSATELCVHDAVADEGISAGDLAAKTGLSLRNTYKHLKKLKNKKLVFSRRTPKTYCLTFQGDKLATLLQQLQQTVEDVVNSTQQIMMDNQIILET